MCFVLFFKQKTAYEMRISDWSSDVCSSDLQPLDHRLSRTKNTKRCSQVTVNNGIPLFVTHILDDTVPGIAGVINNNVQPCVVIDCNPYEALSKVGSGNVPVTNYCLARSEERRVGKECVSTCRSRWAPYH